MPRKLEAENWPVAWTDTTRQLHPSICYLPPPPPKSPKKGRSGFSIPGVNGLWNDAFWDWIDRWAIWHVRQSVAGKYLSVVWGYWEREKTQTALKSKGGMCEVFEAFCRGLDWRDVVCYAMSFHAPMYYVTSYYLNPPTRKAKFNLFFYVLIVFLRRRTEIHILLSLSIFHYLPHQLWIGTVWFLITGIQCFVSDGEIVRHKPLLLFIALFFSPCVILTVTRHTKTHTRMLMWMIIDCSGCIVSPFSQAIRTKIFCVCHPRTCATIHNRWQSGISFEYRWLDWN